MEEENKLNIDEVLYIQMIIQQNLDDERYIEDDEEFVDMIIELNNKMNRIKKELTNNEELPFTDEQEFITRKNND